MKKLNWFILPLVLGSYAALYLATSYNKECTTADCEKLNDLQQSLSQNRGSYFYGVHRCTYPQQSSDTLCVYVKDTLGINWNLFADTVWQTATNIGMLYPTVFIINNADFS